jgi:hypothetical protein
MITGNKPILIFPAGMPRAVEFLQKALCDGQQVVGASSLSFDPAREKYPAWTHLPYVTAPEFDEALKRVIQKFDIVGIYTPHLVVWDYLDRTLKKIAPDVSLINLSPANAELQGYRSAMDHARALHEHPLQLASAVSAQRQLSDVEVAALFSHTDSIPGMCDHEKLRALCEITRHSPVGDIVEIGSWWGKSAFILAWLARCFRLGNLLCVDPWSEEGLIQGDESGLVDAASGQLDPDEALKIFEMNLLPYNRGHINYLRLPSTAGARYYKENRTVATATFGKTDYTGRIALLHIDGNHRYDAVKADIDSWSPMIMKGGWVVFDDYRWPFGDGPKRAGDEFLMSHVEKVAVAFVMGGALFVQLSCYPPG